MLSSAGTAFPNAGNDDPPTLLNKAVGSGEADAGGDGDGVCFAFGFKMCMLALSWKAGYLYLHHLDLGSLQLAYSASKSSSFDECLDCSALGMVEPKEGKVPVNAHAPFAA